MGHCFFGIGASLAGASINDTSGTGYYDSFSTEDNTDTAEDNAVVIEDSSDEITYGSNIETDKYCYSVDIGETTEIEILSISEGYEKSDLVFTSQDKSIATVTSDGTIKGIKSGATLIEVATNDGKNFSLCSVIVS